MAIKVSQLALLLLVVVAGNAALSAVAESTMYADPASMGAASGDTMDFEDGEEMMQLDSESSRRVLYQTRFLSYSVLQKDQIPCGRRGPSYYFCHSHHPIRPYTRGCSRFTRCGGRYR